MGTPRCPGQDSQYWKPDDISFVKCPSCGGEIEFWKDEPVRPCPACGREVHNPKISQGCGQWCKHSEECIGPPGEKAPPKEDQSGT
jgi:hypothetical protein